MQKRQNYHASKMRPLVQIIVAAIQKNPDLLNNTDYLMAQLIQIVPALKDPTKCVNCGASMKERVRRPDYFVVSLINEMALIVRQRTARGIPFTEANKIHVNAEEGIPHNARLQTGVASALGLIAPVDNMDAHWAITNRGWAGLRNQPIPAWVVIFRDQIIERTEDTVTFAEVNQNYKGSKRAGHTYDPREWMEVAGLHQGNLI